MLQVFEEHCFDISEKQLVCLYTYITDLCDISDGYSCALYIKINVIIGEKKTLIVAVVFAHFWHETGWTLTLQKGKLFYSWDFNIGTQLNINPKIFFIPFPY